MPLVASASALGLAGCALSTASAYVPETAPGTITPIEGLPSDASVTVTSKSFTEQLILGKIAAIAAEAAGFTVTDMTNVPGSVPVRNLMTSHAADITYEYTGTAWLTYMNQTEGIADKQDQWQVVHDSDEANGLTWLPPSPENNTYALAVSQGVSDRLGGITSLSQIAELPVSERTFCVDSEFFSRADGFQPMLKAYGLDYGSSGSTGIPEDNVKVLDTGAVYTATADGTCNFGEVFSTDGRIKALDLTVLTDDQHFFPAYNAAPVISTQTLEKYPGLADVFNQISPKLTDDAIMELNRQVDIDGREPADVAYDWMVQEGFISRP